MEIIDFMLEHRRPLVAYSEKRLSRGLGYGEDIWQSAVVNLLERPYTERVDRMMGFCYFLLKNAWFRMNRRNISAVVPPRTEALDWEVHPEPVTDTPAELYVSFAELQAFLRTMPEERARALIMKTEGWTNTELSECLGVSVSQLETEQKYVRRALKKTGIW